MLENKDIMTLERYSVSVDWIQLARNKFQCLHLVISVINIPVP
jgi:hypothetical protein